MVSDWDVVLSCSPSCSSKFDEEVSTLVPGEANFSVAFTSSHVKPNDVDLQIDPQTTAIKTVTGKL